ncbi:MAG: thioredoxin [Methanosarcinaceae archaeon]|nr:thioredoxin [Methanosarcinaceae archaeon]
MKKAILLSMLLATALFISGCIGSSSETDVKNVVPVTDMQQINEALEKGPVLLKIGAEWCPPCKNQDFINELLAEEYSGRVIVMQIDADASPELAGWFNIYSIPDSCVIVNVQDGEYIYMKQDGTTTTERFDARFIGFTEKEQLAETMDHALQLR